MKWIVYTDLDGTLLDFDSYSFAESQEAVQHLRALDIPLIFCSSKTRVEQEVYRSALGLETPFIVENGSAIMLPKDFLDFDLSSVSELAEYSVYPRNGYSCIELGKSAVYIRKAIQSARLKSGAGPKGYADLPLTEIMKLTGLNKDAAERASTRDYSETLLKNTGKGSAWEVFIKLLLEEGLQCVSGGKFHTVMGQRSDKGVAIKLLNILLRKKYGSIRTVGLGDSANDLPLLDAVDFPFLVQKPSGKWEAVDNPKIKQVEAVGPRGFTLAIHSLLNF